MEELNSGPPKTNPSSGREEDLNPGPPDYKSSALTTRPRCLLQERSGQFRRRASAVPNLIVIGSTVARHKHDFDPDVVPNSGLTEVT